MPVAAPLIGAVGAIGSSILGKKSAAGSATPTAAEQSALTAQTHAATGLAGAGAQALRQGTAATGQATNYFSTLANGNRGQLTTALSPEIEAVNKTYAGANSTISRFLRGPDKDMQAGELARERAGNIAGLYKGVRQNAATSLAGIGSAETSAGSGAMAGAGSLFGANASQGASNRLSGAELEHQAGSDFGNLFYNVFKGVGQKSSPNPEPQVLPYQWQGPVQS